MSELYFLTNNFQLAFGKEQKPGKLNNYFPIFVASYFLEKNNAQITYFQSKAK